MRASRSTAERIPPGTGAFVKTHLGPVGVEDISLDVGLAMSDTLFDRIAASWQGVVVYADVFEL